MSDITIFHNPACRTSRNVLAAAMGIGVRDLLRRKGTPDEALKLLPNPQHGALGKEDGEAVVDAEGRRVDR